MPSPQEVSDFEATLSPEVRAQLSAALDGIPDVPNAQADPTAALLDTEPADVSAPVITTDGTPQPAPAVQPAPAQPQPAAPVQEAVVATPTAQPQPVPAQPAPAVQPAPAQPQPAAPDPSYVQQIEQQNYAYQQQAKVQRDNQEIETRIEARKEELQRNGWTEEAINDAVNPVRELAQEAAQAFRGRQVMQDAALYVGEQYNLSYGQTAQLIRARNVNEFQSILTGFQQAQANPQVDALQTQMQQMEANHKAEMEALRKQVVPNGQQHGGIQGATPPPAENFDPYASSTAGLDSGEAMTDAQFQELTKWMGE